MEAIKVLAKILTNILTALYEPFGFSLDVYKRQPKIEWNVVNLLLDNERHRSLDYIDRILK